MMKQFFDIFVLFTTFNIWSANATAAPSVTPSATPSTSPSATPSITPSHSPTIVPSVTPTASPSQIPSATPTVTLSPTASPSINPTLTPTLSPSSSPTVVPSVSPTVLPTTTPSVTPTITPSIVPSSIPTRSPTTTSVPTFTQTAAPTTLLDVSPYYSLQATDAYTWTRGYPQSCECVENAVTRTDCDLFKCTCACDISAGQCDYNCCCDPDCTSSQISRFQALGSCQYEGFVADSVQFCYNSAELYGVNPRSPMGGQSTSREAVGDALCVVKTNYASSHDYYTDTELQSSTIFTEPAGQKEFSYLATAQSVVAVDSVFDRNDSIAAFLSTASSGGLVSNGPGFLQVPLPDEDGSCNDLRFGTFENRLPATECNRQLSAEVALFSSQCVSQFSVQRFVKDLWVARNPTVDASLGVADFSDVVNVQLSTVVFQDLVSSRQTDLTASWDSQQCLTAVHSVAVDGQSAYDSAVNEDLCVFSSPATKQLLISSTAMCAGFVKAVHYTVNHTSSDSAAITAVYADVVLTDLPISLGSAPVSVTQSFSLDFFSSNPSGISNVNGNIVNRRRSGNPGYNMGLPVLYGDLASTVIQERIAGLAVPAAAVSFDPAFPETFGQSLCPQAGQTVGSRQVKFGYDMTTGCVLRLNRTALINMCCQGSTSCAAGLATADSVYSSSSGLPYFLDFVQGYVGVYGDADPLDISQWAQIGYNLPNPVRNWNPRTSTCSNMFSGISVQFLVTASGEKANPQNKIVAAIAEVTTSDWVMNVPQGDDVSVQPFALSTTVSFVFRTDSVTKGYQPPAPPVLFEVPYDVFYPFLNSPNAASRSTVSVLGTIIGVSICSVLMMLTL